MSLPSKVMQINLDNSAQEKLSTTLEQNYTG